MSESNRARPEAFDPRARRRSLLFDGWTPAVLHGGLALGVVAAVAIALALLLVAGGILPGTSVGTALREGWLLFYAFHHAGIEVISPSLELPRHVDALIGLPSGYAVDATVSVAVMGGTVLAAWLMYRAGRAVARSTDGSPFVRGIHGSKVAVPYALASWAASWALNFEPRFPHTSPMSVHPSHVSSLFWPLAIGLAAGFAGGLRSGGESVWTSDWWKGEDWNRRWRGILAGALRMTVLGIGLSTLGLLILGAVHPHDVGTYFRTVFAGSSVTGAVLIVLTALVLPNLAVWLLIPAMGGCLEVTGSAVYQPYCFVGYGSFLGHPLPGPPEPSGFPQIGAAPHAFLLLLLIPLIAVLLGGLRAARRAEARTRAEGALAGALAGLVFAACLAMIAALAMVTTRFNGPFYIVSTGSLRYGPSPAAAFQLGLLWGVAGGAAGGWLARVRPVVRA
jgi:uncharacterized protein DUF6350